MPELVDDEEFWDDDDDSDQPLPILTEEGVPAPGQPESSKQRRKRERRMPPEKVHKGNTKAPDAAVTRDRVISEAQGKATFADPDDTDWRQDLADKDRGKAASKLTSGKLTHNAGSGFGLA